MSEEIKSVITRAVVNGTDEKPSYDFDIAVEHDSGAKYSAKDILAKVVTYMETTPFLYIGGPAEGENGPANKHIGIWLDTTVKQPTRQYTRIQNESN